MTSGGPLQFAAALAVLGLPAERYLLHADHDEQLILQALVTRAFALVETLQRNQATFIANAMVRAKLYG